MTKHDTTTHNTHNTHWKIVGGLAIAFGSVSLGLYLYLAHLQHRIIEENAINSAILYSVAIKEFRTLYTSEVVAVASRAGLEITHNYQTKPNAIPLPATLSMLLGQRIGASHSGADTRLYSAFPFPWREKTGGLQDQFAQQAWQSLSRQPREPFFAYENYQGRQTLRYATADLMRESCVNCHNNHPDTPRKGWRVGDLRGVVEVNIPLDQIILETEQSLRSIGLAFVLLVALVFAAIGVIIIRIIRISTELENRVNEKTADLSAEIVEREKAEDEHLRLATLLNKANKMQALGTLAGGIAHDLNNMLSPILAYVKMAQADLPEDKRMHADLEQVITATQRAQSLVQQVLTFSQHEKTSPDEGSYELIKLDALIDEVIDFIDVYIPRYIRIKTSYESKYICIFANSSQIHQILMNLLTNAIRAMDKAGLIEIRVKSLYLDDKAVSQYNNIAPGDYIELLVSDTGCGMTKEVLEQIFEPYFKLNKNAEGHGLGLSVVYGIIENLQGTIIVNSRPGKGSQFYIYIPLPSKQTANKSGHTNPSTPLPENKKGRKKSNEEASGHILCIDDDAAIRQVIAAVLKRQGYRVTLKEDGISALEAFKQQPDIYDLVLSDYSMPGMTGLELSKYLLDVRADIPIIMVSGYSDEVTTENFQSFGLQGFLMKPFMPINLVQAVQSILTLDNSK